MTAAERVVAGLQVLDASDLPEPNPLVPLLVYGVGDRSALLRASAALVRQYPLDHGVVVQEPRGMSGVVRLGDLAQFELQSEAQAIIYVPPLTPEQATSSPHGLRAIVHRLRAPGGCPWDREQTPTSLTRYVLEEAYEVADAIADGTPSELAEELGDLLLQVYLQAEIAEEGGSFDVTDIVRELAEKLIRRHPHVFGTAEAASAAEVERNWEQLKYAERIEPKSAIERIPRSMPGLARAAEVQRQLSKRGFDWPQPEGAWAKLDEELAELRAALGNPAAMRMELGDLLFMVVKVGLDAGLDAEVALRGTIDRVTRRYQHVERAAAAVGKKVSELSNERLQDLWLEAKRAESSA